MVAYHLLHNRELALSRATRIAEEALTGHDDLVNAVQVALSHGDLKLAERLIAIDSNDPDLAFHAAIVAIQGNDWTAAASLFSIANVPENERRVAEIVVELAPIKTRGRPNNATSFDAGPLESILHRSLDSPRGLILIARVAAELELPALAERAFAAAIQAVPVNSHISTRLMVAAYAESAGSPAAVISLLDGHLPYEGYNREHEWLATAHAQERPHRPRNLGYFENLPANVRKRREIARAYASVLLDLGRLPQAVPLLRRLHANDPLDAFVTLRLLEGLRRSGDLPGIGAVVRSVDLASSHGPPEFVMALAQAVVSEGAAERAYPVAYDLVRSHPNNPTVSLAYIGLGFLMQQPSALLATTEAGPDAFVAVAGPDGTIKKFVIDTGGDFFGIAVIDRAAGMAPRVAGKQVGDLFELPKLGSDPEIWRVTEVSSKYLHLHHRIMEEYETRFPDKPGIARFTVGQDDIETVKDFVRRSAEQNRRNAQIYFEQPVPLAVVARGLGGDEISFAQYVRMIDGEILTCTGLLEERQAATDLARHARGLGAALDPYTAWVAAEMNLLAKLKTWFGTLHVPVSLVAMLDRMIEREKQAFGQEQMTLSWHNGKFYRDQVDDAFRHRQIEALSNIRATISKNCEVHSVLAPNELPEVASAMLNMAGSSFLDAAFIAQQKGAVLLSDDLRYREWANAAVACRGMWLQAILMVMPVEKALTVHEYAKAVVGLAARRHSHVTLNGSLLGLIAYADRPGFPDLKATLHYLGGKDAEIRSHLSVLMQFIGLLWSSKGFSLLQREAATGMSLEALLRYRKDDWRSVLGAVLHDTRDVFALKDYMDAWLMGHFMTSETPR